MFRKEFGEFGGAVVRRRRRRRMRRTRSARAPGRICGFGTRRRSTARTVGRLVVVTDENTWVFEVVGTIPEYESRGRARGSARQWTSGPGPPAEAQAPRTSNIVLQNTKPEFYTSRRLLSRTEGATTKEKEGEGEEEVSRKRRRERTQEEEAPRGVVERRCRRRARGTTRVPVTVPNLESRSPRVRA